MSLSKTKQWYALMSKPQKDAYAEEQLNNQGYTTYRPLAMRERVRRGKTIKITESLFPRYLFINLDAVNDNWAPIQSTYGVSGMVRFGDLPLSIPESLIEQLRLQESQFAERAVDLDYFQNGDLVTIKNGSFEGLNAVFERYSGEERVILLMNILNEQAKVAVPSADVFKTA